MTIKLISYRTRKELAVIAAKDLNKWCDENGYLPHHQFKGGWVVI